MNKLLAASFISLAMLSGCNVELFNSECRAIGKSGYSLCRNQEGSTVFYLEPVHQAASGGGVLDGTVQSIGWNDNVIIASRHSTFRGDPDGFMVVDIASKKIDGPIKESAVIKAYPAIKLANAADAWSKL